MRSVRWIAVLVVLSLVPATLVEARDGKSGRGDRGCAAAGVVADLPGQAVSDDERSDLLYMREEEKLARDVYHAMDDQWGLRVFRNIAGAEQAHMDAVLALLDKYEIPDPVGDRSAGEFANPELQALYDKLVAQGSESLNAALAVGATIEDVDIFDLENALARSDNEDIQTVYQNLRKGSRNHMRAFHSLLESNDVVYTPQFISQVEFNEIVTSAKEHGMLDAGGEPTPVGADGAPGTACCRGRNGRRG